MRDLRTNDDIMYWSGHASGHITPMCKYRVITSDCKRERVGDPLDLLVHSDCSIVAVVVVVVVVLVKEEVVVVV